MTRKETERITSKQAAAIMSANHGRPISDRYVRWLGAHGKIAMRKFSERAQVYNRDHIESYRIVERGTKKETV